MKTAFYLLQNKIKSLATPTPKKLPFNECSKSIVQASADPSKPALTIGTQLPKLPWHEMEFVSNRLIHETDIIQLRHLISLIKDIQQCQNEQYDFFQKYSKYLELDRNVIPNMLCLCAPMDVIKEQQDLLERERNLKAEFTKKKCVKKSISFWARFR
uniref:Uncharacterized protein n=1 Tax=Panagrolaimus davidi TaxID=227884 RepID=A0A914Q898_9BILA